MGTKVYKYRGISTLDRDLESLASNYFFAPTAESLNDPTEAVFNDRLVSQIMSALGSGVSQPFEALIDMRHSVGIYSLSRVANDELMWAHYGESHQGFCIEYSLERLILEARDQWNIVDVTYSETPPTLTVEDAARQGEHSRIVQTLAGHKSRRWEYEDELRIVTTRSGANYHAQSAVTGIYFGRRCSADNTKKIRARLSGRSLSYVSMSYPAGSYKLLASTLPYDTELDGQAAAHEAPIDDFAIPEAKDLGRFADRHNKLLRAVDVVRKDPACQHVVLADVSMSGPREGKIFVQFQSSVKTDLTDTLNWFFDVDDL